eukprot:132191_1
MGNEICNCSGDGKPNVFDEEEKSKIKNKNKKSQNTQQVPSLHNASKLISNDIYKAQINDDNSSSEKQRLLRNVTQIPMQAKVLYEYDA